MPGKQKENILADVNIRHEQFQGYLLEKINDVVIATDRDFRITYWNRAAQDVYGWMADEVLGKISYKLLKTKYANVKRSSVVQTVMETGEFQGEVAQTRRDQQPIDLETKITGMKDEIGQFLGFAIVNREITKRKKLEQKLRLDTVRTQALLDLSTALSQSEPDLQKVLDMITVRVSELVGDTCIISLLSGDKQNLQAIAYHHLNPQVIELLQEMTKTPYIEGQSPHWQVIEKSQPVFLTSLSQEQLRDSVRADFIPYLDQFGIHDIFIVPLIAGSRTLGTLAVSRDRPDVSYSDEDQAFVRMLANRAAQAIFNSQLIDSLQKEVAKREQAESEVVELQRHLIDRIEIERLHLASTLHDEAIQGLYGVMYLLFNIREELAENNLASLFDDTRLQLQKVINQIWITFLELRPPGLVPFGLDIAINSDIERIQQDHPELLVRLDLQQNDLYMSEQLGYRLFRIYKKTIQNVIAHSKAKKVDIRLRNEESKIILEVEDDGIGFLVPTKWIEFVRQGRLGLAEIAERLESVGGELYVESKLGEGTLVRLVFPG